jgi:hypothetical protein
MVGWNPPSCKWRILSFGELAKARDDPLAGDVEALPCHARRREGGKPIKEISDRAKAFY